MKARNDDDDARKWRMTRQGDPHRVADILRMAAKRVEAGQIKGVGLTLVDERRQIEQITLGPAWTELKASLALMSEHIGITPTDFFYGLDKYRAAKKRKKAKHK